MFMSITLDQCRYIVALARYRHFGRAAEFCFISQPSLSAAISNLENALGVKLFDRSKSPVTLTVVGEVLVDQAKKILVEESLFLDLAKVEGPLTGTLRCGVIPTLASYILPLFIENFSKKYPNVELFLSELQTHEIEEKLLNYELDCGLLVTPLEESRLYEEPLFYEPFYVYASKGHPYLQLKQIRESDLDPTSLWLLDDGHCFRNQILNICLTYQGHQPFKNINFMSGSLDTLIRLVRQGSGYTILPYLAARCLPRSEKRKMLRKFERPIPTREVSLVMSRKDLKRDLKDALKQTIFDQLPASLRIYPDINEMKTIRIHR